MEYRCIDRDTKNLIMPRRISLDTEYTELNIRKASLLSVAIGVSEDLTYIIRWDYKLVQEFIDSASTIYFWNAPVDTHMLSNIGIHVAKEKIVDAMLLEHLVDERLDHSLGAYALREYDDNYKVQFWDMYDTYQSAPEEVANEYEMRDGCYTYRAGVRYMGQLAGKQKLIDHVHSLQRSLFDTEIAGIKVDLDLMVKTKQEMGSQIDSYLTKLRQEYGDYAKMWEMQEWAVQIGKRKSEKGKAGVKRPEFSFNSDKQVRWLVYDALECPVIEKTKKGQPSTSYETIKTLGEDFPALKTLVQFKDIKSVYATFVEGMLDRVEDNRIYPGFFINGTATGRISHNNPNMGNLPTTGVVRNFFVPDSGNVIIGADYSQLEVVIEANLTEDKQLLKIILEGASKHDITANGLGISRDQAKTLNFALQYGAGVRKVSKLLGVPIKDAQDVFDRYWNLYAGCKAFKNATVEELEQKGQVTNLFGRTRHFDVPKNEFEKARQERRAVNFMVQGVGADITNMATYRIAEFLKSNGMGRLWFSVHDEIVCEVKKEFTNEAKKHIVSIMEAVNDDVGFKYRVNAKSYGPMPCWGKG